MKESRGNRTYGSGWLQAKKGRSFNDRFSMAGTSCYSYCIGIVVVSSKTAMASQMGKFGKTLFHHRKTMFYDGKTMFHHGKT